MGLNGAAWLSESNKSNRSLESITVFADWLFLFKFVMLCFVGEVRELLFEDCCLLENGHMAVMGCLPQE